ncbi:MAG: MEDS domain-containing protein [Thermodesulfobacteriota bacterium]
MASSGSLAIQNSRGLTIGDHVGCFCDGPEQWRTIIQTFFLERVQENHHCLYLNDLFPREQVWALLRSQGLDMQWLQQQGQLTVLPVSSFFSRAGWPDIEALGRHLGQLCRHDRARGFAGMRLMVDMSWAASSRLHDELLLAFEDFVNQVLLPQQAMLVVCQFDLALFAPELLSLIKDKHPLLVDAAGYFRSSWEAPAWPPDLTAGKLSPAGAF